MTTFQTVVYSNHCLAIDRETAHEMDRIESPPWTWTSIVQNQYRDDQQMAQPVLDHVLEAPRDPPCNYGTTFQICKASGPWA